jgi:hypothetical protein
LVAPERKGSKMGKRVLIGFIALTSLLAFQGGVAEAGCLKWANAGGSSVCCVWSPKGVAANITYNQSCPQVTVSYPGGGYGTVSTCDSDVDVVARDSVAFCVDPTAPGGIRKVSCPGDRQFFTVLDTQCEPTHENNVNPGSGSGGGEGNNTNCSGQGNPNSPCQQVRCTERIVLRAACQDCCDRENLGECKDVTPIEMDTQVRAFNPAAGGDFALQSGGPISECPPGADCVFNEHCSINPNKLKFIDPALGNTASSNQTYQCDFTCVSNNTEACPPPACGENEPAFCGD